MQSLRDSSTHFTSQSAAWMALFPQALWWRLGGKHAMFTQESLLHLFWALCGSLHADLAHVQTVPLTCISTCTWENSTWTEPCDKMPRRELWLINMGFFITNMHYCWKKLSGITKNVNWVERSKNGWVGWVPFCSISISNGSLIQKAREWHVKPSNYIYSALHSNPLAGKLLAVTVLL